MSNLPSVWAHRTVRCAPDTALCNVRCTGSRALKILFSCALSGVHRTGTVDCSVRPYSVFKKSLPARARGQAPFLLSAPCLSLRSGSLPPLPAISLAGGDLSGDLSSPPSGEQLWLLMHLPLYSFDQCTPFLSPCMSISNSCEIL
jgi:hypothetical protein